jgi:hypothetical protein
MSATPLCHRLTALAVAEQCCGQTGEEERQVRAEAMHPARIGHHFEQVGKALHAGFGLQGPSLLSTSR